MSNFNSVTMVHWLRAMCKAMPHGGKKKAAEMLGLTPSGLSKLLTDTERGFDEKTLRAVAWVEMSKANRPENAAFPPIAAMQIGPVIIETRVGKDGSEFWTWRPVVKKAK